MRGALGAFVLGFRGDFGTEAEELVEQTLPERGAHGEERALGGAVVRWQRRLSPQVLTALGSWVLSWVLAARLVRPVATVFSVARRVIMSSE